ncbi:MAG: aspartate/glutamate racemase family protein [Lentimicrobiaceae bacterium]|jgi:aspartate racemase|nr:aspartate/glutamate racemase family protein [Lentimicrobiaceae bacterium]
MKTIGLIGGTSWQSTLDYYRIINQFTADTLGGHNSAKIILNSINFAEVEIFMKGSDFNGLANFLIQNAKMVEKAGADMLLLCANTMHLIAKEVQQSIHIPLVHIADATVEELMKANIRSVGLLGTLITMEQQFFSSRIRDKGIEVHIPEETDRKFIHNIIFNELFYGIRNPKSKEQFLSIISKLKGKGAEGIILGCTEIPLLIAQGDVNAPLFDTTKIHCMAAVKLALAS